MAKNKMFVLEARRMLPLLFLLVLLVSLSLYDSFRASPTVAPEETAPTGAVTFTTADQGERKDNPTFRLAVDGEGWAQAADELAVTLPNYPFQPQYEVALFAVNAEVQGVQTQTVSDGQLEVQVQVSPKKDYYQVVTLPANEVDLEAGTTTWKFMDSKNNVLEQVVMDDTQETITEETPQK